MRVLIVEDEKRMASFIQRGLKEEGYAVDVAVDGEQGWEYASLNDYDVILLDWMLPKMDGLTVCEKIRQEGSRVPVLMLTVRDSVEDKIKGLDHGADDYLTKPFAFDELLARVRALIRRQQPQKANDLKAADLELNLLTREAKRAGKAVNLTSKEFSVLEYLMLNANQIVTRTMISEHVWKEDFHSFTNVIDVHIRYLRTKIDKGFDTKLIHTVRGVGYILKDIS